jgi:uncharacterized membrane protein HdeD (DUF308 family)
MEKTLMMTAQAEGHRGKGGWLIALGAVATLLGLIGFLMAPALTLAGVIWYGALLAVLGAFMIARGLAGGHLEPRWVAVLLGLVYLAAGVIVLFRPVGAALALTLVIGLSLVAVGLMRLFWAGAMPGKGKGWNIASGLVAILLGILIVTGWPSSSLWVIGTFIAIDLVVYGSVAIAVGWALRRAA